MTDNLNYYKVFLTAAKTGSISKAAELLYISQPAVSKSISNLEDNLGIRIFERTSRGVRLTDEGALLYEHIRSAFDSISHAEDELKRMNELGIGQLRIGASTSLCKYILVDYLKDFITAYPHIKISIDCHPTMHTIDLLEEGKIDLGLICHTELPKDLEYIELRKIHDIFVTSQSYLDNLLLRESSEEPEMPVPPLPFAGNITSLFSETADTQKKDIPFGKTAKGMSAKEILEKSNLMLLEQGNITRRHIDQYLYSQNITPQQILEINNMDLLLDFSAIGMGVSSIVKEFAELSLETGEIIELPLPAPIEERTIGFAYRNAKTSSTALEKFLSFCRERTNA